MNLFKQLEEKRHPGIQFLESAYIHKEENASIVLSEDYMLIYVKDENDCFQKKYRITLKRVGLNYKNKSYIVSEFEYSWNIRHKFTFHNLDYAFKHLGLEVIPGIAEEWDSILLINELSE